MYALCVELDNLQVIDGYQIGLAGTYSLMVRRAKWLPRPTYLVASGKGVHLLLFI